MNIVVSGGTGFIGQALCRSLLQQDHKVTVLTRGSASPKAISPSLTVVEWNGRDSGPWEQTLGEADAVINLAGAPIAGGRWTEERKRLIVESRVNATRLLAQAVSGLSDGPRTFISASGIGYYGTSKDRVMQEGDGPGSDFFSDLCQSWEDAATSAASPRVRVVRVRIGMVLEKDGGALAKMIPPFKAFVGGPIMPGTQWVSWIHRTDLIGLIEWSLINEQISGVVNAVAPGAVTMRDFCKGLGKAINRPSWLPVPGFALQLAFGELASFMTTGQRVTPRVAVKEGYQFRYPQLDSALRAIFRDS